MAPRRLRNTAAACLRWTAARATAAADRLDAAPAPVVEAEERELPGAPEHWLALVRQHAPQLLRPAVRAAAQPKVPAKVLSIASPAPVPRTPELVRSDVREVAAADPAPPVSRVETAVAVTAAAAPRGVVTSTVDIQLRRAVPDPALSPGSARPPAPRTELEELVPVPVRPRPGTKSRIGATRRPVVHLPELGPHDPGPVVLRWPDLPDSARVAWKPDPRPADPPKPAARPAAPEATPGPWPRLDGEDGDARSAASGVSGGGRPDGQAVRPRAGQPPDLGVRDRPRTSAENGTGATIPGRWPELPDDTAQWTVAPRRGGDDRARRLDEEQRGLPWNA
ncbi:hypothetical protein [Dactylosporangium sp. NPDC005555]|uniref:hypothetical protein n=1 Tax=Dactylosporangium sp. NPDC005555 TaxID=3154889 RepID=UPI0033BCF2E0